MTAPRLKLSQEAKLDYGSSSRLSVLNDVSRFCVKCFFASHPLPDRAPCCADANPVPNIVQ
eukprot:COSAG02_NODE_1246_length_13659_cov_23.906858_10_plen_61_part_00